MSQPTLVELSISLNNVQSLLKLITAEVKVLSDGIAVLVEQEEAEDLEEELNYLDVDPWSNVNDKDKKGVAATARQNSIRSLMQRRPSTVKDETKALARILSQKRTGTGAETGTGTGAGKSSSGTGSGNESERNQRHKYQAIDEDYASSESSSLRGSTGPRDSPVGDKQELDTGSDLTEATINTLTSATTSTTTLRSAEAERVPHTITVETTQMPTKFSIAITKPSTPHSPSAPVLSSMSSQTSIHNSVNIQSSSTSSQVSSYLRSSTSPNFKESSRPSSVISNSGDGYSSIRSNGPSTQRRSLQPESRSTSEQILSQGNVKDRYTPAPRNNSQGPGLLPTVSDRDSVRSSLGRTSPKPISDKMESADCFSKMGLIPELLRGIYAYGLKMPSILQQRGIPMIMTRHDVLTQAKPEVAKTLTYAIPLLNVLTLPATSIHPQLIILCSNHDLCLHVQRVLLALARFMPTISCLICAEGGNATLSLGTMSSTKLNLSGPGKNGFIPNGSGRGSQQGEATQVIAAHVVIGTPGKVLGLIRTRQISISAIKVMVLENADILLASPLKEATVSLLSMVRDLNTTVTGAVNGSASGTTSITEPLISPPNSGPTSPVSAAVASLNSRLLSKPGGSSGASSSNGGGATGGGSRNSGYFGDYESRPRSASSMSGSSPTSSSPTPSPSGDNPQLLFFSTDVPSHVLDHVALYMTQPTKALVKGHDLALKGILQFFKYMTVEDEDWQLELLCDLLEDSGANRAVVFCNKDGSVEKVVRKIRERKGFATGIYSDMDMSTRKAALGRFRGSATPVSLVMTDESAKDLEISAVPLVISFEIPSVGSYIPRVKWIDRTKGKVGAKVTLVDGHRGEAQILRAIQQHYRTTIDDLPPHLAEFIVN